MRPISERTPVEAADSRERRAAERPVIGRRSWLGRAGSLLVVAGWPGLVRGQQKPELEKEDSRDVASESELEAIRSHAKGQGIDQVRVHRSESYIGLGNAPDDFLSKAVNLCEGLAKDYFRHFKFKGFSPTEPASKFFLVALADAAQFRQFIGFDPGPSVGGLFDLDSNHLVLFDNRSAKPSDPAALRANSVALFHEATHQLTFNTGLLDRGRDVPLVISEGLAMYGEVRRPDGKTTIGKVNVDRLGVIVNAQNDGLSWLSTTQLFDDDTFEDDSNVQMAYAQSWLLIHGLMARKKTLDRFKAYLEAIRTRENAKNRLDDARKHLGDLATLDRDLQSYAVELARS